ncbi:MAG: hypothetical protein MZU95_01835 [Desulfomicrobium escambiense]|nr:hypothetical protein [Desulfomicrobium escambiense]
MTFRQRFLLHDHQPQPGLHPAHDRPGRPVLRVLPPGGDPARRPGRHLAAAGRSSPSRSCRSTTSAWASSSWPIILFVLEVKVQSFGMLAVGGIAAMIIGSLMLDQVAHPRAAARPAASSLPVVLGVAVIVLFLPDAGLQGPRTAGPSPGARG